MWEPTSVYLFVSSSSIASSIPTSAFTQTLLLIKAPAILPRPRVNDVVGYGGVRIETGDDCCEIGDVDGGNEVGRVIGKGRGNGFVRIITVVLRWSEYVDKYQYMKI